MAILEKIWKVDFSDDNISENVWNYEIGYIRNEELQYYTNSSDNSYIENGDLVICAQKTGDPSRPYTSASLNTQGKVEFLYGKLEMVARLPFGTGVWPAFWTLGNAHGITENWPECGEIDIMEMIGGRGSEKKGGGDSEYFATIHYPEEATMSAIGVSSARLVDAKYGDAYHKFGMIWDTETISFYVDDLVWKTVSIVDIPAFHKPHYLLLNLAIGGNWPGAPDETTVFSQKYKIKSIAYTPLSQIQRQVPDKEGISH